MNDVRHFLGSLPYKAQVFLVGVAWVLLFQFLGNSSFGYAATPSLFRWVTSIYETVPDDSLGYIVPPLILTLLYLRRDQLIPLEKRPWAPALILLALAILLHLAGYLIQQARLSLLAFGLGIYSITGLYWGAAWMRATVFPFALLAFTVPVTAYTDPLTFPLRLASTKVATGRNLQRTSKPESHPGRDHRIPCPAGRNARI